MSYKHLTESERYQVLALQDKGYLQYEIEELLQRNSATISRELRRNKGLRGYRDKRKGGTLHQHLRCQKNGANDMKAVVAGEAASQIA